MTADRKALLRTASVAASLSLAALLPAGAAAGAGLDAAALKQHAAAVAVVVEDQLTAKPALDDQKRARALVGSLLATRKIGRSDVASRAIQPINRRDAVLKGLTTNLPLAIGRQQSDIAQTLVREAEAVFDPVVDLSLGYDRQASYLREKLGLVVPKTLQISISGPGGEYIGTTFDPTTGQPNGGGVTPFDKDASGNFEDPLNNLSKPPGNPTAIQNAVKRRWNFCGLPFNPCNDTGTAAVRAMEFYENLITDPTQAEIVANNTINSGHPIQQVSVQVGLTQELPWGGSVQVTDQTIQQRIYYDATHYWQDGQFSSSLTATLNTPVPFGKGFGEDNPDHAAIRNAAIARQQTDWNVKDLNNQILEAIDVAYFELVRQLEILGSTVENQQLAVQLKERQDRIIQQNPGMITRYEEAQVKAEVSRAAIAVEQQLQAYLSASVALAQLIGDPDARTGSVIYLPYGYARDLDTRLAVTFDGALSTAHLNRPAFFIANLSGQSADVALKLAQNQARPDIQFTATGVASENGSLYGYSNPVQSQISLTSPDNFSQNYSLVYAYPWLNRGANAAVDIARLSTEDQGIVIHQTDTQVRQEIATDLANVQGARAQVVHAAQETKLRVAAYDSLVRQLEAGLVGNDQIIQALRNRISAEQAWIGARISNREAEAALLYAQGTIANVLPGQVASSALDQRRLTLLADAGVLKYFGAQTAEKKQ